MINRYQRLFCVLILFAGAFLISSRPALGHKKEKPNILLIFVDDLGYGDLGCYGSTLVPTPNIDKIAATGIKLTDGYASSATCAPSRLGLMTGRYQQRIGGYSNTTCKTVDIPKDYMLMPEMLKIEGYKTAHIGKWHINHPVKPVFDKTYNEINGLSDYFPGSDGKIYGVDGHRKGKRPNGWINESDLPSITDIHADSAITFIEESSRSTDPFFLYLAFNAPHGPWQALVEDQEKFKHISPEVMQIYASMIQTLDENVGRVMDQLKKSGVAENTLVVFASDNGPEWGRDYIKGWPANWDPIIIGSADPLSGRKALFQEGGIRVPFIISWPGKLDAGSVYSHAVTTRDLFETFGFVAGSNHKYKTDGVNILPFLNGQKKGDPHKILFWRGGATQPVYARVKDWKIEVPSDGSEPKLFNLSIDIGEKVNVANENTRLTKEMIKKVRKWEKEITSEKR